MKDKWGWGHQEKLNKTIWWGRGLTQWQRGALTLAHPLNVDALQTEVESGGGDDGKGGRQADTGWTDGWTLDRKSVV